MIEIVYDQAVEIGASWPDGIGLRAYRTDWLEPSSGVPVQQVGPSPTRPGHHECPECGGFGGPDDDLPVRILGDLVRAHCRRCSGAGELPDYPMIART